MPEQQQHCRTRTTVKDEQLQPVGVDHALEAVKRMASMEMEDRTESRRDDFSGARPSNYDMTKIDIAELEDAIHA